MDDTPNLGLPYIMAAQSQKHVTHNEAIRALDAMVQLAVLDRDLAAPPGSPAEGARYIVGSSPTGAWSGHADEVAAYQDGAWMLYAPVEGWIAWIADEDIAVVWDGTTWSALTTGGGGGSASFTTLAINGATADTTNRLSLNAPATLLNHDGAGHQLKINKAAASDTASLLYQDAFSGRAELGLAGDDDFHFKVSPDGSTWKEAIVISRSSGVVTFPFTSLSGGRELLAANRAYYVRSDGSDANTGLVNSSGGAFLTIQKAMDVIAATLDLGPYVVTVQIGDGTYTAGLQLKSYRTTSGYVVFRGNVAAKTNVVISTAGTAVGNAPGAVGYFQLLDFKVVGNFGLNIDGPGMHVDFNYLDFGTCTVQLQVQYFAWCQSLGNFSVSGNAVVGFLAGRLSLLFISGSTITYANSPVYAARNFQASEQARVDMFGVTFTNGNTVTGKRYEIDGLGAIFTNAGGASYIPGNSAGSVANSGLYY